MRHQALEERKLGLGLLVAALRLLLGLVDPLLDGVEVREDELGRHDLDVPDRVDRAHRVDDVGILEAAHDVDDRVHLADVREELVAEALALAGAGDEAGDVHELDRRGDDDPGLRDLLQDREAVVGHRHDPDVGIDGAERIVGRLGLPRAGEGVEEGGLAHVGEPDDACFEHGGLTVFGARAAVNGKSPRPYGESGQTRSM